MEIKSPAFENNELIPKRHTCDGEDINPELEITGVPAEAKSLALIVEDPDSKIAPSAGGWVHWTLWNIDHATDLITSGNAPKEAVEGMTDFGRPGYGGPCPVEGKHRYFFRLFALDKKLELAAPMRVGDLREAMKDHIIAEAELVGLYSRNE